MDGENEEGERREEEGMRERDKGKEKENVKGRKRLSAMPRF